MCFDNHQLILAFQDYESNLMNEKFDKEREIWLVIDDLLAFLEDLDNLGLYHGDLQPAWIKFNHNKALQV